MNPLLKTTTKAKTNKARIWKAIIALRDSTQTTTQAIRESCNALNKNLLKSVKEGMQEYDEITNRNIHFLTGFNNSNHVDSTIVKTVSIMLSDKIKNQIGLKPVEGNPNLFTMNPTNRQEVLFKGSTMTFLNGNINNLNDSIFHLSNLVLELIEKQITWANSILSA